MKKILAIIAICFPIGMQAQSIDQVLQNIERNNKELQSQIQLSKAQKMENRTDNNLSDPTISYSSFYKNGAGKGHGTETVISQEFDFPTQYITRNKQASLANEAVDKQYQATRRDILLQAKQLCLDLILLNQTSELLELRMKNANDLQTMYEKRLQEENTKKVHDRNSVERIYSTEDEDESSKNNKYEPEKKDKDSKESQENKSNEVKNYEGVRGHFDIKI